MENKTKYIKGLDGLRALAVVMVLAYHLKSPFAKSGLLGVTVFFVLSGFLITRILITEIIVAQLSRQKSKIFIMN